jgi:hypothetical protein
MVGQVRGVVSLGVEVKHYYRYVKQKAAHVSNDQIID